MTTTKAEPEEPGLNLALIEATFNALPRIPRFPAYFNDMRLLIDEVKRLQADNVQLVKRLEESERWCKVIQRLYYRAIGLPDMTALTGGAPGKFECCSCGEIASKSEAHVCPGRGKGKGEIEE